jgi:hypothetical protein
MAVQHYGGMGQENGRARNKQQGQVAAKQLSMGDTGVGYPCTGLAPRSKLWLRQLVGPADRSPDADKKSRSTLVVTCHQTSQRLIPCTQKKNPPALP